MKRLAAQLRDSKQVDYDPDERGEVVSVGQHHGNSVQLYMAHKVTKLRELQGPSQSNQESTIFKGCIFYINGFTDPPIDELRRLISRNGGECLAYRAFKITHFVCNYLTDAQLKHEHAKVKFKNETMIHYVVAAWITDSIQNGKRLNENLYNPAGLSKQHGSNISTVFKNINNSNNNINNNTTNTISIRNESPIATIRTAEVPTNTSSSTSTNIATDTELTSSQQQFLHMLPIELHPDAILEIENINAKKKIITKNQSEILKSSLNTTISIIDVSTPSTSSSSRTVLKKEDIHRKEALGMIVEHIHYNSDGSHASSKEVIRRIGEYIRDLIQELNTVLYTTIETTSSGSCNTSSDSSSTTGSSSGSRNSFTSSSNNNTINNDNKTTFHQTIVSVQQQLIDYGIWLVHENLLEQAQYFVFVLRKYCYMHQHNDFICFCMEILATIRSSVGNKAGSIESS